MKIKDWIPKFEIETIMNAIIEVRGYFEVNQVNNNEKFYNQWIHYESLFRKHVPYRESDVFENRQKKLGRPKEEQTVRSETGMTNLRKYLIALKNGDVIGLQQKKLEDIKKIYDLINIYLTYLKAKECSQSLEIFFKVLKFESLHEKMKLKNLNPEILIDELAKDEMLSLLVTSEESINGMKEMKKVLSNVFKKIDSDFITKYYLTDPFKSYICLFNYYLGLELNIGTNDKDEAIDIIFDIFEPISHFYSNDHTFREYYINDNSDNFFERFNSDFKIFLKSFYKSINSKDIIKNNIDNGKLLSLIETNFKSKLNHLTNSYGIGCDVIEIDKMMDRELNYLTNTALNLYGDRKLAKYYKTFFALNEKTSESIYLNYELPLLMNKKNKLTDKQRKEIEKISKELSRKHETIIRENGNLFAITQDIDKEWNAILFDNCLKILEKLNKHHELVCNKKNMTEHLTKMTAKFLADQINSSPYRLENDYQLTLQGILKGLYSHKNSHRDSSHPVKPNPDYINSKLEMIIKREIRNFTRRIGDKKPKKDTKFKKAA